MIFKVKKQPKEINYKSEVPNVEQDSIDEISEITKKRRHETQVFENNTNANFFSCLIFNTQEQRDEFIKKVGIEVEDGQYINGLELAEKIGITIESKSRPAPKEFKVSSKLVDLCM